ncbi:hypothetical protein ACFVFS_18920 [Kitasatospora sp. NPDC057692]|uniref:hypothetical protein n=1 Tax=Kitasatospora sp. NPDC057692 TaxID=3346215 RepID=UPI00367CCA47
MEILLQVLIGSVPAVIGFLAARFMPRAQLLLRYGFLRRLLAPYNRVQIVTSSVEVAEFSFDNDGQQHTHTNPKNVLFLPLAEGRAIGQLIDLLRKANHKVVIELVAPGSQDPRVPTFSIGGPSVNRYSAGVLGAGFPEFGIEYPEARRARWAGMTFETRLSAAGELIQDHGFLFVTRTSQQAPCFVLCGILAFGTAMAVDALSEARPKSHLAGLIRSGDKGFVAVEGRVTGLDMRDVRVEVCRNLSTS